MVIPLTGQELIYGFFAYQLGLIIRDLGFVAN